MANKRTRRVQAKPGQLVAAWGRAGEEGRGERPDIQYAWGGAGASKPDGRILCNALEGAKVFDGKTLCAELEVRGYDLTTLRFSIERKAIAAEGGADG